MVTLGHDSRATVIVTGTASDEQLQAAISEAGTFTIEQIEREGLEPYRAR